MHTSAPTLAIILDTAVKSTVLLGFAWGAALALKKSSAATQHLVRTFALAALLLLPFSVMFLPAWHVKGVPQLLGPSPAAHPVATRPASLRLLCRQFKKDRWLQAVAPRHPSLHHCAGNSSRNLGLQRT
jgi:hypothetical protein